eukprot:582583_1
MQRNQVDDKNIAAPRRDHVKVPQRTQTAPQERSGLDCLHPQVERVHQSENSNGFVIIRPGHGSGNVAGHNRSYRCCHQSGMRIPRLHRQKVNGETRQGRHERRRKHTNVSNVDGNIQKMSNFVENRSGPH